MAGFVELYIDQGTTFNSVINLTDDTTNTPMNIAGYSVSSQIRRSHYSANASGNLICAITNAQSGEITLFMSKANTAGLRPGRYVFDVEITDQANVTSRVLEGIVNVTPRVTR
jgi:hypothetical protein